MVANHPNQFAHLLPFRSHSAGHNSPSIISNLFLSPRKIHSHMSHDHDSAVSVNEPVSCKVVEVLLLLIDFEAYSSSER